MPGGSINRGGGGGRRNNRGRWTRQEHDQFLSGLEAVGETWCLVATYVPTRTELQVRTHAQKYFRKVRNGLPFPEEPYASAAESDGDVDDNTGAPIDGGAAAAAAAAAVLNGAVGPHACLPPAVGSRHGLPATPPAFDGFSSDSRSPSWAPFSGGEGHGGGGAPLSPPRPVAAAAAAAADAATAGDTPPTVDPNTACLAHNLDGVWLHDGPAHAAPAFMGQQQHYQRQQQLPPWQGYGYDDADMHTQMVGGRFSPPQGEAAPFQNWPVADGDLHANLLHDYGMGDVGASAYGHEDE